MKPISVVSVFPVDSQGLTLIHFRSEQCKRAANVWSMITGGHEFGETIGQAAQRELHEEYGLHCMGTPQLLGQYENILPDAHFIITAIGVRADVAAYRCMVPALHPKTELIGINSFAQPTKLFEQYPFHESFCRFVHANGDGLFNKLRVIAALG